MIYDICFILYFSLSQYVLFKRIKVVIAVEIHLFPFRTEKLSPPTPMVLPLGGRVGSRQPF